MKTKNKNKRVPLSMIRLHKLAYNFCKDRKNALTTAQDISDYLKFINNHKNDIL